ncbi:MAG: insulinase family protein [Sphingopyxis sp.]
MIRIFIALLASLGFTAAFAQTAPAPLPTDAQTSTPADVAMGTRVNAQTPAATAWGYANSDIPVDPDVRFGVLANGMKYALRHNATPQSSVLMRLHFDVGSFYERDDERGAAHFLEHMAFNGSTHVPEGEMVALLERKGLAFGADTNASTGFEATSYRLDLPGNGDDLVDTGLMLFEEVAQELLIAPEAVERERGVVQSERRTGDNYARHNIVDAMQFGLAGTVVPDRLPIGTEASIAALSADQLRNFYNGTYRPERATLVIVGDFDVDAMEARVIARFADWQGRGAARAAPSRGRLDFARSSAADIFTHPAIAETVEIDWLKPWELLPDTQALRQESLLQSIGESILRRRFSRIALSSGAPIIGAGFSESGAFDLLRSASLTAQTRDGQWRGALALIEQEYRRAMDHGFTDAEVAEQLAGIVTGARNWVAGQNTRDSGGLAGQILSAADGRGVVSTPDTYLAMVEAMTPGTNGASVSAAFRAELQNYGLPLIRVTSKTPVEGGEGALLSAYDASSRIAVAANAAQAVATFAYTDFGTPGAVISDDRIEDVNIRRVRFANGVMLNIKRTDFDSDSVQMMVRVDGGGQLVTRADPTRLALTPLMGLGGLEAHSADDLRSIFAGRSVSRSFGAGQDAFGMSASTTPADMALQAQIFAATLLHPGYRPEAVDLLRRALPAQYAAMDATPGGALGREINAILSNNDPLTILPPLEAMMALDWQGYRVAVADSLAHGAIEVGIVGDVDEDAAIAAIAATLGALPDRRPAFTRDPAAFERTFAQDLSLRTIMHRGEADQAIIQAYWPARDGRDLHETLQLTLLGSVMQLMLTAELREKLGQSYSPSAGTQLSDDFPGYGYLFASASVARGSVESVEAAISAVATRLRDEPIPDDLLSRARQPLIEAFTQSQRENGYWLGYVGQATSRADYLDRNRNAMVEYQATTPGDLSILARRYLLADHMLRIRVVAAPTPAPGVAPVAASTATP